jgi:hypothetical protein
MLTIVTLHGKRVLANACVAGGGHGDPTIAHFTLPPEIRYFQCHISRNTMALKRFELMTSFRPTMLWRSGELGKFEHSIVDDIT